MCVELKISPYAIWRSICCSWFYRISPARNKAMKTKCVKFSTFAHLLCIAELNSFNEKTIFVPKSLILNKRQKYCRLLRIIKSLKEFSSIWCLHLLLLLPWLHLRLTVSVWLTLFEIHFCLIRNRIKIT